VSPDLSAQAQVFVQMQEKSSKVVALDPVGWQVSDFLLPDLKSPEPTACRRSGMVGAGAAILADPGEEKVQSVHPPSFFFPCCPSSRPINF
jgi:hypothetical protein